MTAPASATRAIALAAAAAAGAAAPACPQPQAHPRRRRRPRTGAWRGSWPWRNPRNGSWPWENPRNDFLAILHSKDQHLLNYMNMNLCCKEEKHLERDHGFFHRMSEHDITLCPCYCGLIDSIQLSSNQQIIQLNDMEGKTVPT